MAATDESILDSVKKSLGITTDCTDFDSEIIMHINSGFSILNQLGVGPLTPFYIEDKTAVWSSFDSTDVIRLARSYMFLKVKLIFDPPTVASVLTAYQSMTAEYEWRLNIMTDTSTE